MQRGKFLKFRGPNGRGRRCDCRSIWRLKAAQRGLLRPAVSIHDHNGFGPLRELLHSADVTLGNCEMTFPDAGMIPAATDNCGDLNNRAEGPMAEELRWAGFNLMGTANNHALDYAPEGMLTSSRKLDQAGI
jgi:poly-gamma-glutamate synthesis protein (capsule biosynthesis protein)